jgi:uncharacterized membrane protein YoaK (UPF0700 family)
MPLSEESRKAIGSIVVLFSMALGAVCGVYLGEYLWRKLRDRRLP